MSLHEALIEWRRAPHSSAAGTYSRQHLGRLNGGQTLALSASAEYLGDADCADPEQMLVSALASCHMLFFLAIAERRGHRVESYRDAACGTLEKNGDGRLAVTRIRLAPEVEFAPGTAPDDEALAALHRAAHRNCFIAHSITARVDIEVAAETV